MGKVSAIIWTLVAATGVAAVPLAGATPRPRPAPAHGPAGRADPVDPERAAALRARAEELSKDRTHFRAAADLFEQAASLTPVEDGARAQDLYVAANLHWYTGSAAAAEADMAQSADAALERGDVEAAADAFASAAWIATKRQEAGEAREYALRALHLAASPLLSDELRERIRQRVIVPPVQETAPAVKARQLAHTGWSVAAQRAPTGATRTAHRPLKGGGAPAAGR